MGCEPCRVEFEFLRAFQTAGLRLVDGEGFGR